MSFLPFYIEQKDSLKGLYKMLCGPDDADVVQKALDAEVLSNGDNDPAHYRVIEIVTINTPSAKRGSFSI